VARFLVAMITNNRRPELMQRAIESVRLQLPLQAVFKQINDSGVGLYPLQWHVSGAHGFDYYVLVDDDDIVVNDGMQLLVDCVRETGADLAFTNEEVEYPDGRVEQPRDDLLTYGDVLASPRAAHHLCAVRAAAVDEEVLRVFESCAEPPMDWLMRARVAAVGLAVHIPRVGYRWRCSPDSFCHRKEVRSPGPTMRAARFMQTWCDSAKRERRLPRWMPDAR